MDWKIGYCPERINPGDRVHTLTNIRKRSSRYGRGVRPRDKKVYDIVIKAGTFPVSTHQDRRGGEGGGAATRDINIAFMNEVALMLRPHGHRYRRGAGGHEHKWERPGL